MNEVLPFILAVLGLLATPGPTNTLMAASGAQQGFRRSLPLLFGELCGYFIAITVWIEVVGAIAIQQPWVAVLAKLVAVAFLLWSAWKLWKGAGRPQMDTAGITLNRVFLTTLLNPKGLIFAFAVFPPTSFAGRLPYLGVFAALVVATAIGWIALGAMAARGSAGLLTGPRVERATALALLLFAVALAVQTIGALH
jgi:threonine/homoserine/homoserine lactone efflux protein